eukprot:Opistho-2@56160
MAHRGAVIITLLVCIALVDAAGVSLWSPPLQCDSSLIDGCNTLGAIPCMGKRVSANYPVVAACDAQQSSAQTSKMGAITVFSMNATLPRRTFQPGETFKLSVSLRDKPTYRVALNISSRVPANVNVGTTTLVFTPENYGIAQGIDVTITAGAAVRPYFRFSLNQTRPVTCEALCLRVNASSSSSVAPPQSSAPPSSPPAPSSVVESSNPPPSSVAPSSNPPPQSSVAPSNNPPPSSV